MAFVSLGIWEYIQGTRDAVVDLEKRVRLAKLNVEQIANEMAKWSVSPFYSRKDGKDVNLFHPEVANTSFIVPICSLLSLLIN